MGPGAGAAARRPGAAAGPHQRNPRPQPGLLGRGPAGWGGGPGAPAAPAWGPRAPGPAGNRPRLAQPPGPGPGHGAPALPLPGGLAGLAAAAGWPTGGSAGIWGHPLASPSAGGPPGPALSGPPGHRAGQPWATHSIHCRGGGSGFACGSPRPAKRGCAAPNPGQQPAHRHPRRRPRGALPPGQTRPPQPLPPLLQQPAIRQFLLRALGALP